MEKSNDRPKSKKGRKRTNSNQKTSGDLLMEITALAGEYPAKNIHRIIPTKDYDKKVAANLVAEKMLKKVSKDDLRGYRLNFAGKRKLMEENPERFRGILEGGTETNRLRTTKTRRLRLHSFATVCTIMYNAGVEIFQDKKPKVYLLADIPSQAAIESSASIIAPSIENPSSLGNQHPKAPVITTPCFYTSREQKGEKDNAIRGSRAAGTLLTPTHVYAIYNTGNGSELKWHRVVEQRFSVEVQDYICRKLLLNQYNGANVGGIMIGESLDILEKYLTVTEKKTLGFVFLTRTYWPFYYITNDEYGDLQLKLLCDDRKMAEVKSAFLAKLLPPDKDYPIEHDARTEDGKPVLFCCLLDIPRLDKFREGLRLRNQEGKVVAFDFQEEMLKRYLGDKVEVATLNFQGYRQKFFPQEKKTRKAGGQNS
ncbi:MAG: hypothetical protein FWC66_08705 [Oscillospiraceae bacterium]|nr:hypothetical protein [Oscillospiraceae bacterium]